MTTKVEVLAPYSVSHDGTIYRPGDLAEVPELVARAWLASGWVQAVDEHKGDAEGQAAEDKPAPAPRTSSSSSSRRR